MIRISSRILEKIGLADQANELARNLPYGAQRRLEIARALATEPLILLLDEPAAGMNPQETGSWTSSSAGFVMRGSPSCSSSTT